MFCPNCGYDAKDAKFCQECGTKIELDAVPVFQHVNKEYKGFMGYVKVDGEKLSIKGIAGKKEVRFSDIVSVGFFRTFCYAEW